MNIFKKLSSRIWSLTLVSLCSVLLFSTSGHALELGIKESEKAVFAFYKLTKQIPDYQKLVESMKIYKKQSDSSKQQKIFEDEFVRLKIEYTDYSPARDYLKIKTDIYLQLRMKNEKPILSFKFLNSGNEEIPYFPYPFAEEWIAVITKGLNRFTSIALNEEQYARVKPLFKPNEIYKGKLNLELRAISADKEHPVETAEGKQWLMLADIALLEFLYPNPKTGEKESLLGEYKAEWYREKD